MLNIYKIYNSSLLFIQRFEYTFYDFTKYIYRYTTTCLQYYVTSNTIKHIINKSHIYYILSKYKEFHECNITCKEDR